MDESGLNRTWNMTNAETYAYLEKISIERTYHTFLPAILFVGLLGLVGLLGNSLVLIVYTKYFKHNPSRVFIIFLAVFDLISNVLCIPGEIIDLRHSYSFPSSALCRFFRYNNFFATISSVLTLVAISVERYKKICRPHGKQLTEITAYKTIGVIVAVTCIVSLPSIILSGLRTKKTPRPGVFGHDCTFSDKYRFTVYPQIYLGVQFLVFVICAVVLVVLYSLIGMAIYRQKHKRLTMTNATKRPNMIQMNTSTPENSTESTDTENGSKDSNQNQSKPNRSTSILSKINKKRNSEDKPSRQSGGRRPSMKTLEKYKTTFMLLTITVAFILSYLPYLIISVVKVTTKDFESKLSNNGYIVYTVFLRSFFINAAVNSIIYSFWNQTFRDGVKKLFLRKSVYAASQRSSQIHSF